MDYQTTILTGGNCPVGTVIFKIIEDLMLWFQNWGPKGSIQCLQMQTIPGDV